MAASSAATTAMLNAFEVAHGVVGILDEDDALALHGLDEKQAKACRATLRDLVPMNSEDYTRARALAQQVTRGPCPANSDPGRLDSRHQLWVAWRQLGDLARPKAAEEYVRLVTSALVQPQKAKDILAKLGRSPVVDRLAGPIGKLEQLARQFDLSASAFEVIDYSPDMSTNQSSAAALRRVASPLDVNQQMEAVFDAVTAPDESAARLAPRIDEPALRLSPLTPPVVPTAVTTTPTSAAPVRPTAPATTTGRTLSSTGADGTTDIKIAALAARLEQLERRYDQQRQTSQQILLVALVLPFLVLTVDRFWNRR